MLSNQVAAAASDTATTPVARNIFLNNITTIIVIPPIVNLTTITSNNPSSQSNGTSNSSNSSHSSQKKKNSIAYPDDENTTWTILNASYEIWKQSYVVSSHGGKYRRVTTGSPTYGTVSEGMGYGMLLAAYFDDQPLFDDLWGYVQQFLDPRGLMHWSIASDDVTVVGKNGATDADEDMALALIVADQRWGKRNTTTAQRRRSSTRRRQRRRTQAAADEDNVYREAALTLLDRILLYEIENGTNVVKPGDVWGGAEHTNPSYFSPGFYHVFANYTGNTRWNDVADQCYATFAALRQYNAGTGLAPEWCTARGTRIATGTWSYNYEYNACRVPWRLALDYLWFQDPRAEQQLQELNAFWNRTTANNNSIWDGYSITGTKTGATQNNAAFVATAAAGAVASNDTAYRRHMWDYGVNAPATAYYPRSLHVLGLLTASGNMGHPLLSFTDDDKADGDNNQTTPTPPPNNIGWCS